MLLFKIIAGLTLISFLLITYSFSKDKECDCEDAFLHYDEIDIYTFSPCKVPDTINSTSQGVKKTLIIESCDGKATFKSYDRVTGKLKVTGRYIDCKNKDSIDTLVTLNEETYEETITLHIGCTPIKDGEWVYYND